MVGEDRPRDGRMSPRCGRGHVHRDVGVALHAELVGMEGDPETVAGWRTAGGGAMGMGPYGSTGMA